MNGPVAAEDVWVKIVYKSGPNEEDWTTLMGQTNGDGEYTQDFTPHTTATFWWAVIVDPQDDWVPDQENPVAVDYPDHEEIMMVQRNE